MKTLCRCFLVTSYMLGFSQQAEWRASTSVLYFLNAKQINANCHSGDPDGTLQGFPQSVSFLHLLPMPPMLDVKEESFHAARRVRQKLQLTPTSSTGVLVHLLEDISLKQLGTCHRGI